jgi:hypothetical protein
MGMGSMHHLLSLLEFHKYQFDAYLQYNNDTTNQKSANFKYLLFNYHQN